MPYCTKCGKEIDEGAAFCPSCGSPQNGGYNEQPYHPSQNDPYTAPRYQSQAPPVDYDSGSFGWFILGFFIPLVGLILFLVWIGNKPKSAKMAGLGALINVILTVIFYVFIFGLMFAGSSSSSIISMFI